MSSSTSGCSIELVRVVVIVSCFPFSSALVMFSVSSGLAGLVWLIAVWGVMLTGLVFVSFVVGGVQPVLPAFVPVPVGSVAGRQFPLEQPYVQVVLVHVVFVQLHLVFPSQVVDWSG